MYKLFIKRLFDIIGAIIFLPFLLLIIIIFAPIIYLQDKGSVFYIAPRLGRNSKIFKMIKLRTMSMNAPDLRNVDGTTYNSKSDTRQTTVGRFLRKTSIDELPQVLNVLLGHMSFIGPRPDLPEALMIYTIEEKGKLKVRPGITGYSQAYYRNSVNLKDRFMQDLFYSNNVTYLMDIKILFKTISTVIFSKDIYRNND